MRTIAEARSGRAEPVSLTVGNAPDDVHSRPLRLAAPGGGDAAAVYAAHARVLLAYARRFGDASLAEDIVQEVFLRVLLYRRADSGSLTLPFLLAMTRNVALRALARSRRAVPSRLEDAVAESLADRIAAASPAHEVGGLLADLSERQRDTVELTEIRGLSENQAALALSMTRSAVSARRRKAIGRLRRMTLESGWSVRPREFRGANAA